MANRNEHVGRRIFFEESEIDPDKPWISYLKWRERHASTLRGSTSGKHPTYFTFPLLGNGDISGPNLRQKHAHLELENIHPIVKKEF